MGSLWRSEDMTLVQMTMQRDAAHDTVDKLGELGLVEFKDLSEHLNAFQRQYANQVKRCEELERIVRFFEEQIHKSEVKPSRSEMNNTSNDISEESLDDLETRFSDYEQELRQLQTSYEQMMTEKNKSEELYHVIRLAEHYRDSETSSDSTSSADALLDPDRDFNTSSSIRQTGSLSSLTGVIPSDKISVFSMLVFRATRGNCIPRFSEISEQLFDPRSKKLVAKSVFTIYFGANRARDKIRKICESLGASIHEVPELDINSAQHQLDQKIDDINVTINSTKDRMRSILGEISGSLISWKKKVAKEKAIYHTLNLFNYNIQNSVVAEGWVPKKHLEVVRMKMDEAISTSGSQVQSLCEELPTSEIPPTYFEVNKFTACFQDIVNAYGVPKYKEMNPGVMTIITFPFLFAVMFGDYGHGVILTLASLTLVLLERKLQAVAENSEMFGMLFSGRYVLLLMGMFSIYTGLLYNDCFGLGLNLFGSEIVHWDESKWEHYNKESPKPMTYVFGVDPAWYGTSNKLQFYNSTKMKMSVLYGIAHMTLGIIFSAFNHVYFGHYIDIFVEFIPEIIIILCTFGYMDFLIIFKWCRDWRQRTPGQEVPGILATMTDFFLHPWGLQEKPIFFNGQAQLTVQLVCLLLAGISVPILLIPKPIYEWWSHRRAHKKGRGSKAFHKLDDDEIVDDENSEAIEVHETHAENEEEPEPFSEMFIKQLIHTIEFSLGAVSNTASYLRLWALSLAHAQLSEVFYDMTIGLLLGLEAEGAMMTFVVKYLVNTGIAFVPIFGVWFAATVGVLLGMESLSAFLHALRLHWVEFQGKFYKGDGHLFAPLDYSDVLKAAGKEREFDD